MKNHKTKVLAPWLYRNESADIEILLSSLSKKQESHAKVKTFLVIAFAIADTKPQVALDGIKIARGLLSQPCGFETLQLVLAEACCLSHLCLFSQMYELLSSQQANFENISVDHWKVYSKHLTSVAALHTNRFAEALRLCKQVIASSYANELQPLRGRSLSVVGIVAGELGMNLEAANFFERARFASIGQAKIALPAVLGTNNEAWNLCLVAEDLIARGNQDEAMQVTARAVLLAKKAIDFAISIGSLRQEINAVETLAAAFILKRDFKQARTQLKKLTHLVNSGSSETFGAVKRGIVSQANLEIEAGNCLLAIRWLKTEYDNAQKLGRIRLHKSLLKALERAYIKQKEFEKAYAIAAETRLILFDMLRDNTEILLRKLIYSISDAHQDWLAYISHDLRSPIYGILSMTQSSVAVSNGSLLQNINFLANIALSSLNRYLAIARMHSDLEQLVDIELGDLVEQVIESINSAIDQKKLVVNFLNIECIVITGDWNLLFQAVTNLMNNAVAAAPANTQIIVDLGIWEESCILNIQNEGLGFAPGAISKLFDLDVRRLDVRRNFGLPIAAFAIEKHGGALSLRNGPDGNGVCVTVVLPRLLADD